MQYDPIQQHTPAAEQPHLAQVRLEADMLRGAVIATGIQYVIRAIHTAAMRFSRTAA
ncbi:hypothetical protein [Aquisalimonas asiatica]|uniref:Uncharacterized protein n=1 Tax=Aquisalimonas asiatica TaxID=406100 RepID=A0A1H8U198_9GAMM|nr:hypothetical protein [Aquisalimonas asiatica]SEO96428.1 hypothetical protein SAMN04488052_10565 [Aquisalimonas asiatica]